MKKNREKRREKNKNKKIQETEGEMVEDANQKAEGE